MLGRRKGHLDLTLRLPDLLATAPLGQLSAEELRLIEQSRQGADSSLAVFLRLLEYAELDAPPLRIPLLSLLLQRPGMVVLRVIDPQLQRSLAMRFSLPRSLLRHLRDTPIAEVLDADSRELARRTRVIEGLIERLKKDLTVLKIVLVWSGTYSAATRLGDIMSVA